MFIRGSLLSGVAFLREAEGGAGGGEGGTKKPAADGGEKTYNESYVQGLRREAQTYRERLEAVETEFGAHRTKATADLQAAMTAAAAAGEKARGMVKDAALRLAAKEAGMRDADGLKMLDTSAVKVDDDGKVAIPDKFFEDAKKAKGYLFEEAPADTGNTSGTPKQPAAPKGGVTGKRAVDMTDDEYKAAKAAALKV